MDAKTAILRKCMRYHHNQLIDAQYAQQWNANVNWLNLFKKWAVDKV